ncbi:NAD(P)H-dependent oxidoreductase [Loktanella sp. SALINAS62]|uniref:NAD(P)H-dependent oxidoreductase n=1 Tax=Loktanella sp. SALINAS62 TaxID=2706124 RepID=UPI001B8C3AAC|nr:NAD(P)H-dependent oxidoreductase [Loktanella sp. SALINAS62]MBS1303201.1 NAD(P)H-dependent oxidoreductase [Loktanella sp. SALINAS62]
MLMDDLQWRYATKKMDPSKTVPDDKVDAILEALRLAPTSSGTQPFEVLVITNKDIRAKLSDASFGQKQLVDGSHVLVFAVWDDYTNDRIDMVRDETGAARGGVTDQLRQYYEGLKGNLVGRDADINVQHAAKQAYIALGVAMVAAAAHRVDSTPMEGFDPDAFDEILGLRDRGLRSSVMLVLGYRAAEGDWLVDAAKVRRAEDRLFTRID